jgi:hypothetical protein
MRFSMLDETRWAHMAIVPAWQRVVTVTAVSC